MKDYEIFPPLEIEKARGAYLYSPGGRNTIDAISSWWCKSLGHAHPRIAKAVKRQISKFEHVISANTCNSVLSELSERLASLMPGLDKLFYADNGSTAIEIAMKMSLQYHAQTGNSQKTKFASLSNGYHGETLLTLSAGDCGIYSSKFSPLLINVEKLSPIPYVSGIEDPLWKKIPDNQWLPVKEQLEKMRETLCAVLLEPIVQGAGGMKIYSQDFLRRISSWTKKNNVHLIADEIMTGFGRTGRFFACEHAAVTPDYLCMSKGLSAGWAPFAAVLCTRKIYEAFYDDYSTGKAFLHSNTFCGYAIGAAAALENLKIMEEEQIPAQVAARSCEIRKVLDEIRSETSALSKSRGIGFVAAAEIVNPKDGSSFEPSKRTGFNFYRQAVVNGALLRPLGDTVYLMPPLNCPPKIIDKLKAIALKSLKETLNL